jgi:hypothetical protein
MPNAFNITWFVIDNKYEVISINHLICIMTGGIGFITSGNVPSNYLTANYIQIMNIDCNGKENISTINNFSGSYDGQNFEIQNLPNNITNLFPNSLGNIKNIIYTLKSSIYEPTEMQSTNTEIQKQLEWKCINGYYEISSDIHLQTLLQNGIKSNYINIGEYPIDWYKSNYLQNIDIDIDLSLLPDSAGPHNGKLSNFSGLYDGQKFTLNTSSSAKNPEILRAMAIFSSIDNAIIKNINTNNIIVDIINNSSLIQNCNSKNNIFNQLLGSNNIIYNCISTINYNINESIELKNNNNIINSI